jgi:outer membrane protein OmpA-like peptidoglycan-associated protein
MRTKWMIWLILGFNVSGYGQNLKPKIAPFKGDVYIIPDEKKVIGFGSYLDSLTPIKKVEYKRLNIPDRTTEHPFPKIDERYVFGMLINSIMKIDTQGYYDFHLTSDDGSRLWINGKLVIDNDGDHKMTLKSDTILLQKGIHEIKLWYYQAYALRYGLIFEFDFYKFSTNLNANKIQKSYNILFAFDKASVDQKDEIKLNNFLEKIDCSNLKSASIFGHTDNTGNNDYNKTLSMQRAKSVATIIQEKCPKLEVNISGLGESDPDLPNTSDLNKSKNRRVGIQFHE